MFSVQKGRKRHERNPLCGSLKRCRRPGHGSKKPQNVLSKRWAAGKEADIIQTRERLQNPVDFYVGKNNKALPTKYKDWIGENKFKDIMSIGTNKAYRDIVADQYRATSFIGDGGTAAIRKFEIETGLNCDRDNKNHAQKVKDSIRYITIRLEKMSFSAPEFEVLYTILNDLKEADI